MAIEGREGASSVLVLGEREGGVLRRAVAEVVEYGIDHLVGIAAGYPVETWREAIEAAGLSGESVTLLVVSEASQDPVDRDDRPGMEVRKLPRASLGDLGIAAVDSISAGTGSRPGAVVDSVGALSEDPGKRFKFLSLLGQRLSVDDGAFVALEGPHELPEHERQTLSTVFDVTRNGQ